MNNQDKRILDFIKQTSYGITHTEYDEPVDGYGRLKLTFGFDKKRAKVDKKMDLIRLLVMDIALLQNKLSEVNKPSKGDE